MQENLKHTLPSDSLFELLQESSIDLRIGYQAQQLEWLSLRRTFEADFPPEIEDRPATFSSLPVSCRSVLLAVDYESMLSLDSCRSCAFKGLLLTSGSVSQICKSCRS